MAEDDTDGQVHSAAKNALNEAEFEKLEMEADVRIKEDSIRNILSPHESYVMGVQGLLVWENPRRSFILLLCVNGFVWLIVSSNYNIVFKVTLSCITAVTAHTFYKKIWPDMKVVPKSPVPEGFILLEPELLQFHDICHYVAVTWRYSMEKNQQFWQLRKKRPGKFCLLVCSISLCLLLFGLRVSGAATAYLLATWLVTIPGILHRGIHKQLYSKVEPYLTQMEHSMEDTPRKTRKKKRLRASRQDEQDSAGYSSSDQDLEDFIPPPGPALDAALAHATAPYENTPGSSTRASPISQLVGGMMPKGVSLELTDDDILTDNENNSFAFRPIEDIPAFDQSDSIKVRRRRTKPPDHLELLRPQYQLAEPLLTRDMSETHFQAIPPPSDDVPLQYPRPTPSSSSEDLLDTSPELPTDSPSDDEDIDMPGPDAAQLTPEFSKPLEDNFHYEPSQNETSESVPDTVHTSISVTPMQGTSRFSQAASAFLSETVASVTSLVSGGGGQSASTTPEGPAEHHESGLVEETAAHGKEPDLSEYEMLDTSEINDNERNSRTEEENPPPRDGSLTEFFSNISGNLFGKK